MIMYCLALLCQALLQTCCFHVTIGLLLTQSKIKIIQINRSNIWREILISMAINRLDSIQAARKAMESEGLSLRKAAERYGLPKSTLYDQEGGVAQGDQLC